MTSITVAQYEKPEEFVNSWARLSRGEDPLPPTGGINVIVDWIKELSPRVNWEGCPAFEKRFEDMYGARVRTEIRKLTRFKTRYLGTSIARFGFRAQHAYFNGEVLTDARGRELVDNNISPKIYKPGASVSRTIGCTNYNSLFELLPLLTDGDLVEYIAFHTCVLAHGTMSRSFSLRCEALISRLVAAPVELRRAFTNTYSF